MVWLTMLTILEVDDFWSTPAEKIRALEQRDDLRYVLVKADHQRYAEARGRHVVIEHGPVSLPRLRSLTELIQLHRPMAIVSRASVAMLLAISLASVRLAPRPALIGRWCAGIGVAERAAWKLIHRVHGFDVVFVADRIEASEASELGLDRHEVVARDDFAGEVTKIREIVANLRAGLHEPR